MAKNLTIQNTAGSNAHEAVALRVTSQQSAFTWLSIEGYQVTFLPLIFNRSKWTKVITLKFIRIEMNHLESFKRRQ